MLTYFSVWKCIIRYKETWAAKREADAARMRQLEAEAAARNAAQVKASDASRPGSSPSSPSPSSDGAAFAESTMSSGEGSSGPAPRVQAASIYEPSQARAGAVPLSSPLQSDITCLRSCLPPYVPGACSCLPGPLQCLPSSANDLQPACPPPDPVQTRESPREQAGTLSTRTAHDMKSGCRQSGQSNQGSEHAWLEKSGQTRREGSVL